MKENHETELDTHRHGVIGKLKPWNDRGQNSGTNVSRRRNHLEMKSKPEINQEQMDTMNNVLREICNGKKEIFKITKKCRKRLQIFLRKKKLWKINKDDWTYCYRSPWSKPKLMKTTNTEDHQSRKPPWNLKINKIKRLDTPYWKGMSHIWENHHRTVMSYSSKITWQ